MSSDDCSGRDGAVLQADVLGQDVDAAEPLISRRFSIQLISVYEEVFSGNRDVRVRERGPTCRPHSYLCLGGKAEGLRTNIRPVKIDIPSEVVRNGKRGSLFWSKNDRVQARLCRSDPWNALNINIASLSTRASRPT